MANNKIITSDFKLHHVRQFIESITEPANTIYYVFAGKPTQYVLGDTIIDAPNNSVENYTTNVYDEMVFAKQITQNDVKPLAKRYDWVINQKYEMYDSLDLNLQNKNFYAVSQEGGFYYIFKCLDNNNGANSTSQPLFTATSAEDEYYETADGYVWKYMYKVDSSTFNKFATLDYIPVIPDSNVSSNAINGSIDVIKIQKSGQSYNNHLSGEFFPTDTRYNGSPLQYRINSLSASSADDFYEGCIIKITSGIGTGQYRRINSYKIIGGFKFVFIDKPFNVTPTNSKYEISPRVLIRSDGRHTINAEARALVNSAASNSIYKIDILDKGKGYFVATANVYANPVSRISNTASDAELRIIYSPKGGHGHDVESELFATRLGISVNFSNNEFNTIPTDNDFRTIGVLKDPKFNKVKIVYNIGDVSGEGFRDTEELVQFNGKNLGGVVAVSNTSKNVVGLAQLSYILANSENTSVTYSNTDIITVANVTVNAIASLTTNSSGFITSTNLISSGYGFPDTVTPVITVANSTGGNIRHVNAGIITGYNNISAGRGYTNSDFIEISGPLAIVNAIATMTTDANGSVQALVITNSGKAFLPNVSIPGSVSLSIQDPVESLNAKSWKEISTGGEFTVAIDEDNLLYSWGLNSVGQLGDGTTTNTDSPNVLGTESWTSISSGRAHTLAIRNDGLLFAWGQGQGGALGNGDTNDVSSPVQIGSASWSSISAGSGRSAAIRADGLLFSWGAAFVGNGASAVDTVSSPVQIGTEMWNMVSAGYQHVMAIRADGLLFAWGFNDYGQLGDETTDNRSSPVQIGSSTWSTVSSGKKHTLAIKTDGTLFSWGQNNYGQLGDGTTDSISSPVQIGSGNTWVAVAAGNKHSLALTNNGYLYSWGYNHYGQLGTGSNTSVSSPVQVGSSTWSKIHTTSTGSFPHSAAITANGATGTLLYTWGGNYYGQGGLGFSTEVIAEYKSDPTLVGSLLYKDSPAFEAGDPIYSYSQDISYQQLVADYETLLIDSATNPVPYSPISQGIVTDVTLTTNEGYTPKEYDIVVSLLSGNINSNGILSTIPNLFGTTANSVTTFETGEIVSLANVKIQSEGITVKIANSTGGYANGARVNSITLSYEGDDFLYSNTEVDFGSGPIVVGDILHVVNLNGGNAQYTVLVNETGNITSFGNLIPNTEWVNYPNTDIFGQNYGFNLVVEPTFFIANATGGNIRYLNSKIVGSIEVANSGPEYAIESITINSAGGGYNSTKVLRVDIINGGIGYDSTANNRIVFAAPGSGTTANAIFTNNSLGTIQTITMVANGTGYTTAPSVTVANGAGGFGANLSAVLANVVNITASNGYGAVVYFANNGSGNVTAFSVANAGFGYFSNVVAIINDPVGNGANLSVNLGSLASIYDETDKIIVIGSQSNAIASLNLGLEAYGYMVPSGNDTIVMENSGYLFDSSVSVNQVIAQNSSQGNIRYFNSIIVKDINVESPGYNGLITSNSDIIVITGGAINSTANVISNNTGYIDTITLNNSGRGFVNNSTLTIFVTNSTSGDIRFLNTYIVSEISINDGGVNYSNTDYIMITTAGNTSGISALANIETSSDGTISSIMITHHGRGLLPWSISELEVVEPGTGYSNADVIEFCGGGGSGANAVLVTHANGTLDKVYLMDGGSNYDCAPTIEINTSTGSSANIIAKLIKPTTFRIYNANNNPSRGTFADLSFKIRKSAHVNVELTRAATLGTSTSLVNIVTPASANINLVDSANLAFTSQRAVDATLVLTGSQPVFDGCVESGDYVIIQSPSGLTDLIQVDAIVNSSLMALNSFPSFTATGATVQVADVSAKGIITEQGAGYVSVSNVTGFFEITTKILGISSKTSANVLNIYYNDVLKSGSTINQLTNYKIQSINGQFIEDEVIHMSDEVSNSVAYYHSGNTTSIFVIKDNGGFLSGQTVFGELSGASATISSSSEYKYDGDLVRGSGDIIYIENIYPISRSNSQSETVKLILEF